MLLVLDTGRSFNCDNTSVTLRMSKIKTKVWVWGVAGECQLSAEKNEWLIVDLDCLLRVAEPRSFVRTLKKIWYLFFHSLLQCYYYPLNSHFSLPFPSLPCRNAEHNNNVCGKCMSEPCWCAQVLSKDYVRMTGFGRTNIHRETPEWCRIKANAYILFQVKSTTKRKCALKISVTCKVQSKNFVCVLSS